MNWTGLTVSISTSSNKKGCFTMTIATVDNRIDYLEALILEMQAEAEMDFDVQEKIYEIETELDELYIRRAHLIMAQS